MNPRTEESFYDRAERQEQFRPPWDQSGPPRRRDYRDQPERNPDYYPRERPRDYYPERRKYKKGGKGIEEEYYQQFDRPESVPAAGSRRIARFGEEDKKDYTYSDNLHLICVDGSSDSDKAVRYALENLPKRSKFVLLHGIYSPLATPSNDQPELARMHDKYMRMCDEASRNCTFVPFRYTLAKGFADGVCRYAKHNNAQSIVMGHRKDASLFRRRVLGSTTKTVIRECNATVTVVK
jgi:hypothetical protein